MPTTYLLRDWQSFYMLTGTAAATLIGLIFLAFSLGARIVPAENNTALRGFVVPIVMHYGAVLVLSALLLMPIDSLPFLGLLLLAAGLVGFIYNLGVLFQLRLHHRSVSALDWRHWLWHWLLPAIAFALLAANGLFIAVTNSSLVPAPALAALVLLVVGLRNSFDLFLFIARQTTA